MNYTYIYRLAVIIAALCILSSCDDFLDDMPDNRTTLDTPDKIKNLLVTSYPDANYSVIAEFSADNFIDNNAPNAKGIYYNLPAYDRMDEEIFAWKDIESSSDYDSPYQIWERFYHSIASTNHALEAIEKLENSSTLFTDEERLTLSRSKGEALMIRAYCHFILVNIFCAPYKNEVLSLQDQGIAYVTKPETEVGTKYDRGTVAGVYENIAKDIEDGIDLVSDNAYSSPQISYHFNEAASHAFAAKFYLFTRNYDKVIEHANKVLPDDASTKLRDWTNTYNNVDAMGNAYISTSEKANLLLMTTVSAFQRRFNFRFGNNEAGLKGSIDDSGPTWSARPPFLTGWIWTYDQKYGIFTPKIYEYFEYTDKVAKIGYPHIVRTEFTTDALLLDRAEAYIFKNDLTSAVRDLQTWNKSHRVDVELTADIIENFYVALNSDFSKKFNTQGFIVTDKQKPYVDCVLHFRRLERIYEGDRWFDMKRYGIELTHYFGRSNQKLFLSYDNDHRAIQIPIDAIGAGVEPNKRLTTNDAGTDEKTKMRGIAKQVPITK